MYFPLMLSSGLSQNTWPHVYSNSTQKADMGQSIYIAPYSSVQNTYIANVFQWLIRETLAQYLHSPITVTFIGGDTGPEYLHILHIYNPMCSSCQNTCIKPVIPNGSQGGGYGLKYLPYSMYSDVFFKFILWDKIQNHMYSSGQILT